MAIASVAAEYVFSDFLLKGPTESKYKGLRLELAADKIVTLLAVGMPLFLISLAFAQEVSVGEWPQRQLSDVQLTHEQHPCTSFTSCLLRSAHLYLNEIT